MKWPFRKHRELRIPKLGEQRWTVAEGEMDGVPFLVRFNEAARELAGHSRLPIKLGFAIPLNRPNPGAFPHADENRQLASIEDLIVERVLANDAAMHVLTVTTGEMKECVFYVAEGLDIASLHASIQNMVSSHEVQCMAIREPDWESFHNFVP